MIERLEKNNRMSKVVSYGDMVYLAGIVPDDVTLSLEEQTLRVLEIAQKRFDQAGTDKDHLIRADIFLKDINRDFKVFNEIWDKWVSDENPPVRACVEANMSTPTTLVEIVFTAVKK